MLLHEHQMFVAVARAILSGEYTEGAQTRAPYKILIPADPDLLPLMSIVGDDFTSLIEPEGEVDNETKEAPFIVYASSQPFTDDDWRKELLENRCFDASEQLPSLASIVNSYRPVFCVKGIGADEIDIPVNMRENLGQPVFFKSLRTQRADFITEIDAEEEFQLSLREQEAELDINADRESFDFIDPGRERNGPLNTIETFIPFGPMFEKIISEQQE